MTVSIYGFDDFAVKYSLSFAVVLRMNIFNFDSGSAVMLCTIKAYCEAVNARRNGMWQLSLSHHRLYLFLHAPFLPPKFVLRLFQRQLRHPHPTPSNSGPLCTLTTIH